MAGCESVDVPGLCWNRAGAAWLRCAARMVRQLPSNVRYVYRSQSPRPVRLMM
jgi:hypothetical protein